MERFGQAKIRLSAVRLTSALLTDAGEAEPQLSSG
jgi:hypothetical protein